MNDLETIKNSVNISDVIGRSVQLKKKGPEMAGHCPFHEDSKESLMVNDSKQIFKCFACGTGGDVFDFFTKQGKTVAEAKALVLNESAFIAENQPKKITKKAKPEAKQVLPTEPAKVPIHYRLGKPSLSWKYHTKEGNLLGYILRFETENGKEFAPYTYRENAGWKFKGFDSPRPLYNLHLIEKNPNAIIIMVEGEKTAEATQKHFDSSKAIATCWIAGANSITKTDFSPIQNRTIRFCPDNDIQGLSAMMQIWDLLNWSEEAKIIALDYQKPKGYDFADSKFENDELRKIIAETSLSEFPPNKGEIWEFPQVGEGEGGIDWQFGKENGKWFTKELKKTEPTPQPQPEPDGATFSDEPEMDFSSFQDIDQPPPEKTFSNSWDDHFRMLGFEKNDSGTQKFYYFVYRSAQTIALSPSGMTKSNLLLLAPLDWWETSFPGAKGGFSAESAANMLIDSGLKVGIFNTEKIRGRGAWMDQGQPVFHNGGDLIVNGKTVNFNEFTDTKFIYEAGYNLGYTKTTPLKNTESSELLNLCTMLNWDKPINAYLLAGWCAIAPVCGALPWRPHIWITGAAGTGKTWTFNNIVKSCLGKTLLWVEGDTTEAGIRQEMKQDALPVIFDEAEGEDRRAQDRMQNVLTLMRGSSSSAGSKIIKGSGSGSAIKFSIRSCFAYASIGVQLTQASDRSRVSVLTLLKDDRPNKKEKFEKIQKKYFEMFKGDFVERLQNRTLGLLPIIIANCKTFASAAATVLGDQRSGDQIGALLAGAYSLTSNKEISFEGALEFVKSKEWESKEERSQQADEIRLFTHLMERITTIDSAGFRQEITIGQLVETAMKDEFSTDMEKVHADKRLLTLGFKVDAFGLIYVSNTAEFIRKSLAETPWAKNHTSILKRIKGAEAVDSMRFGSAIKSRAVSIPLDILFND
jgi:putative DNA primase/helicase